MPDERAGAEDRCGDDLLTAVDREEEPLLLIELLEEEDLLEERSRFAGLSTERVDLRTVVPLDSLRSERDLPTLLSESRSFVDLSLPRTVPRPELSFLTRGIGDSRTSRGLLTSRVGLVRITLSRPCTTLRSTSLFRTDVLSFRYRVTRSAVSRCRALSASRDLARRDRSILVRSAVSNRFRIKRLAVMASLRFNRETVES